MKPVRATLIFAAILSAAATAAADLPFQAWGAIFYANGPSSVDVADFDRDGHPDVATTMIELGRVYITFGGPGPWSLALDEDFDRACYVRAADVNNDGWIDVVASQRDDANGMVKWWRNPGNGGGDWGAYSVTDDDFTQSRSFAVGDLDGDGDVDIVVAGLDSGASYISWYENLDGVGANWFMRNVATGAGSSFLGPHDVVIADFNGDGNPDVGAVAYDSDEVAWFLNDGSIHGPLLWPKHTVATGFDGALCIAAADIDEDGDTDLVAGAFRDDDVKWYENQINEGIAWEPRTITTALDGVYTVQPVDLDLDGDLDILTSARGGDRIVWYEMNVWGGYEAHDIGTGFNGARSAVAADYDSDGDLDIVAAGEYEDRVAYWQNFSIHHTTSFGGREVVESSVLQPMAVDIADLDLDGKLDIVSTNFNTTTEWDLFMWSGGPGDWDLTPLGTNLNGATAVRVADVNADGLPDLVAAGAEADTVRWYRGDGSGSFVGITVATGIDGAKDVDTADFDCDGDLDIAAVGYHSGEVLWFENDDGTGLTWTPHLIDTYETPWALRVGDFDRDGHADLVVADITYGAVWVLGHLDCGALWAELVVDSTYDGAADVEVGDFNGDGWPDIVAAGTSEEAVTVWLTDPTAAWTWTPYNVDTTRPWWGLSVADLNHDGATDIVGFSDSNLRWWLNNGQGTSWAGQTPIDSSLYGTKGAAVADVDDDGLPDVVAAGSDGDEITLYENTGGQYSMLHQDVAPTTIGDAEHVAILRFFPIHRGISGDPEMELRNIHLSFDDGTGAYLTTAQANALIEGVSIWYDANKNGILDPPSDIALGGVPELDLNPLGMMTVAVPHGGSNPAIDQSVFYPFFVVVTTTADASSQTPNTFRISHRNTTPVLGQYYDWPGMELRPMRWNPFYASTVTCSNLSDLIFADGFESGSNGSWDQIQP